MFSLGLTDYGDLRISGHMSSRIANNVFSCSISDAVLEQYAFDVNTGGGWIMLAEGSAHYSDGKFSFDGIQFQF